MGCDFYNPYVGRLFQEISHIPEFEKDLKKLKRRYNSLEEDLRIFVKVANAFHKQDIDGRAIFNIPDLSIRSPRVYKAKKFACKALKGKGVKSGIRVIYAYHEDEDRIEFIEIYYKGDKNFEDRERIEKYYG